MSFSSLVQDIAYRDEKEQNGLEDLTNGSSRPKPYKTKSTYTATTATSVSIAGDIKSQLHSGYSHPLSRAWQAERQLTKVTFLFQIVFSGH